MNKYLKMFIAPFIFTIILLIYPFVFTVFGEDILIEGNYEVTIPEVVAYSYKEDDESSQPYLSFNDFEVIKADKWDSSISSYISKQEDNYNLDKKAYIHLEFNEETGAYRVSKLSLDKPKDKPYLRCTINWLNNDDYGNKSACVNIENLYEVNYSKHNNNIEYLGIPTPKDNIETDYDSEIDRQYYGRAKMKYLFGYLYIPQ